MKKKMVFAVVLASLASVIGTAHRALASDVGIEVGTEAELNESWNADSEGNLVGGVWISQDGQLKVRWEGVTWNAGKLGASTDGNQAVASVVLPAFALDLKTLFGADWKSAVNLQLGAGSSDDSLARGTTDTKIGTIALSLTQTLKDDSAWHWSMSETVSGAGYFRREFHSTGAVFEAVPVAFSVNQQLVHHFSKDVAVSLAIGAYGSVVESLKGGMPILIAGGSIAPAVQLGERFTAGLSLDAAENFVPGVEGSGKHVINATAFVRYVLAGGGDTGRPAQAIRLQLGAIDDQTLGHSGWQALAQYTVQF